MIRRRDLRGTQEIFSIGNSKASSLVVIINRNHWRALFGARLDRDGATASEKTTWRQVNRAGYFAL